MYNLKIMIGSLTDVFKISKMDTYLKREEQSRRRRNDKIEKNYKDNRRMDKERQRDT